MLHRIGARSPQLKKKKSFSEWLASLVFYCFVADIVIFPDSQLAKKVFAKEQS